jgi:hypothetical protein
VRGGGNIPQKKAHGAQLRPDGAQLAFLGEGHGTKPHPSPYELGGAPPHTPTPPTPPPPPPPTKKTRGLELYLSTGTALSLNGETHGTQLLPLIGKRANFALLVP